MADEPIKGSPIAFSDKTIAKALANIYRKKFNIKTEIEPELFLETVRLFNLAAATGISDAVDAGTAMSDDDFLKAIKTNNEVFSAFRVHKMQNDIAKMMVDDNGKLKSFSKFAKDVKPYTDHKNRAWLQTEYSTAVIRAHQAADWQQFERDKDVLPNLEWMPSTSPNPGADHQPFWRTILPIEHPFWNEHRPGDRWNCKCRLRNTDEPPTTAPTGTKNDLPQRGLENNPGKDGKLFSDKHPYMPQSCAACPFGRGKLWALAAGREKNCTNCRVITAAKKKALANMINSVQKNAIREQRKELTKQAKSLLCGKKMKNKNFQEEVIISGRSIKEIINQPHKYFKEKNEAILEIDSLFEKSSFLGPLNKENETDNFESFLFETKIAKNRSWIIVRKYDSSKDYIIYSISDQESLLNYLK